MKQNRRNAISLARIVNIKLDICVFFLLLIPPNLSVSLEFTMFVVVG